MPRYPVARDEPAEEYLDGYAETAPIPRFASKFYEKYANRLVYGTDMGFDKPMYRVTFRILESLDEPFYETEQFDYPGA
jgi:predicted TIM-barrel fold metal-dependent hydrolase